MPFLDVYDGRLYYEVHGNGPPLVFLHGLGGNHLSWWQQVAAFAEDHTCVTLAQRGHPPSTAPADPSRLAGDLSGLLDHLRLPSSSFVAQSLGGWGLLEFLCAQPSRVRAAAFSSTIGTLLAPSRLWAEQPNPHPGECSRHDVHPAAGKRMADEQPELHTLYSMIDRLAHDLDKARARRQLAALCVRDVASFPSSIPTMWLFGDEDLVPRGVRDWVKASFPQHRFVTFSQTGHSAYFERARLWNTAVRSFLADVEREFEGAGHAIRDSGRATGSAS